VLFVGERVVASAALEAREARLLAIQETTEERLVGPVQAAQHVLEDVAVKSCIFREGRPEVFHLRFLLVAAGGAALPASPPGDPLLQRRIVEPTAAPQDLLQCLLLGGCWLQLLFVGLADHVARCADNVLFHTLPSLHAAEQNGKREDFWLKPPQARLIIRAEALWLAAG